MWWVISFLSCWFRRLRNSMHRNKKKIVVWTLNSHYTIADVLNSFYYIALVFREIRFPAQFCWIVKPHCLENRQHSWISVHVWAGISLLWKMKSFLQIQIFLVFQLHVVYSFTPNCWWYGLWLRKCVQQIAVFWEFRQKNMVIETNLTFLIIRRICSLHNFVNSSFVLRGPRDFFNNYGSLKYDENVINLWLFVQIMNMNKICSCIILLKNKKVSSILRCYTHLNPKTELVFVSTMSVWSWLKICEMNDDVHFAFDSMPPVVIVCTL